MLSSITEAGYKEMSIHHQTPVLDISVFVAWLYHMTIVDTTF